MVLSNGNVAVFSSPIECRESCHASMSQGMTCKSCAGCAEWMALEQRSSRLSVMRELVSCGWLLFGVRGCLGIRRTRVGGATRMKRCG